MGRLRHRLARPAREPGETPEYHDEHAALKLAQALRRVCNRALITAHGSDPDRRHAAHPPIG